MHSDARFRRESRVVGYCDTCGKARFLSRKAAKSYARRHLHDGHPNEYRCPHMQEFWHIGNLHPAVISGRTTRDCHYATPTPNGDQPMTAVLTSTSAKEAPMTLTELVTAEGNDMTAVMSILLNDLHTYRYVTQVPVGAALARRLIDLNAENNRNLRTHLINKYARDMRTVGQDGKPHWRERTGQTVKIATNGRLLDGNHRMHAIVRSGKTYLFDLCFGVDPEDMPVIDAGGPRTANDTIKAAGGQDLGRTSPIVRHIISWESGGYMGPTGSSAATPLEIWDRYRQDPGLFDAAARRGHDCMHRNVGTPAATGIVYFLLAQHPEDKPFADDFYDQLVSGIYPVSDPTRYAVYRLREKLLNRRSEKLDKAEMIALIIRAWNRWNTLDSDGRRETVDRLQASRRKPGSTQLEMLSNANFPLPKRVPKAIREGRVIG